MVKYSTWLEVPLATRNAIAERLGFRRIRSIHVSGDRVVDDGFDVREVEHALSVPSLQSHLGSEKDDANDLFREMVYRIDNGRPSIEYVVESHAQASDITVPDEETLSAKTKKKNA